MPDCNNPTAVYLRGCLKIILDRIVQQCDDLRNERTTVKRIGVVETRLTVTKQIGCMHLRELKQVKMNETSFLVLRCLLEVFKLLQQEDSFLGQLLTK